MRIKMLLVCACLGFSILACSTTSQFSVFNQPTATATASLTPTVTPTMIPTPTLTPTPTPVPAARVASGDTALRNGDWEQAIYEFETARQSSTDAEINTAALLGIGRTRLRSGNLYEAVRVLEDLTRAYPQSPHLAPAYFLLGQAYFSSQRYTEAAQAYQNYLSLRPGIIDGYVLDLRGDALFAAGDYPGASRDFQAALQSPSLVDGITIEMKYARSLALSGESMAALNMYDQIFSSTESDNTRALILLRKGQIFTNLDDPVQANEMFLQAVNNYPTAYESYSSLLALVEAEQAVDELQRGLVDFYAGEYGAALAAFERYLQANPADPASANYYSGLSQRGLGYPSAAIPFWDAVIADAGTHLLWDDAYEQKAYTQWAFLDQYTNAVLTLLDFVNAAPNHERAGEFLFDAAQVAERAGELRQAVDLWLRVAVEYPEDARAPRSVFLAGISLYRLDDFAAAQATFRQYLGLTLSLYDRAAAYLWIGKCQQAAGDPEGARLTWQQAASVDPTGYYSERAVDLLNHREPFTPPEVYDLAYDASAERRAAETWITTTFGLPVGTDFSGLGDLAGDPAMIRGMELWDLDLFAEARDEFESVRLAVSSDPVKTYRLANFFSEIGLHRSATFAARQVLDLAGLNDASSLNAPMHFNRLRFATHYADLIIPAADQYDFHPLFLFSVIRQESLFESFVRSSAAASGLMQIIPATGQEIAGNLGWPDFQDADLYRPLVSIRFGTDYLATQRSQFDGDLYHTLAAYNGGPGNSAVWASLAQGDPDLFLEVIRFSETRNYIRAIVENFAIYRRLYDRTP